MPKNKLYIVEGIPGSGKTTFARKLAEKLKESKGEVNLYVEGDLHPADMAWCALLTETEYQTVMNTYQQLKAQIEDNSTIWKEYRIVAYVQIPNLPQELYTYFESKEVFDGRVGEKLFCSVQEGRWNSFGKTATGLTIFECAFLQNSINELLLFNQASENRMEEYLSLLAKAVQNLEPTIIYLDVDTKEAIDRAASERVDEHGTHVWEQRVIEYIAQSPYGKQHQLHGIEGMYTYFETRKQIEHRILKKLPVTTIYVKIDPKRQAELVEEAISKIIART